MSAGVALGGSIAHNDPTTGLIECQPPWLVLAPAGDPVEGRVTGCEYDEGGRACFVVETADGEYVQVAPVELFSPIPAAELSPSDLQLLNWQAFSLLPPRKKERLRLRAQAVGLFLGGYGDFDPFLGYPPDASRCDDEFPRSLPKEELAQRAVGWLKVRGVRSSTRTLRRDAERIGEAGLAGLIRKNDPVWQLVKPSEAEQKLHRWVTAYCTANYRDSETRSQLTVYFDIRCALDSFGLDIEVSDNTVRRVVRRVSRELGLGKRHRRRVSDHTRPALVPPIRLQGSSRNSRATRRLWTSAADSRMAGPPRS